MVKMLNTHSPFFLYTIQIFPIHNQQQAVNAFNSMKHFTSAEERRTGFNYSGFADEAVKFAEDVRTAISYQVCVIIHTYKYTKYSKRYHYLSI